jgi:hypothetical protein
MSESALDDSISMNSEDEAAYRYNDSNAMEIDS